MHNREDDKVDQFRLRGEHQRVVREEYDECKSLRVAKSKNKKSSKKLSNHPHIKK